VKGIKPRAFTVTGIVPVAVIIRGKTGESGGCGEEVEQKRK